MNGLGESFKEIQGSNCKINFSVKDELNMERNISLNDQILKNSHLPNHSR